MIDEEDPSLCDDVLGEVHDEDEEAVEKKVAVDKSVENGKFFEGDEVPPAPAAQ